MLSVPGLAYKVFACPTDVPLPQRSFSENSVMTQPHTPSQSLLAKPRLVIGIDWADKAHAVCCIDPLKPQKPHHHPLEQQAQAIAEWAAGLRQKYPEHELCVCLEQSHGALFYALLATGHFTLYPINPKQLARFREALHPTGRKSDPGDAELLARFLLNHREQLRPARPDSEQTRLLGHLTELRRSRVEDRKRVTSQLADALKLYFPLILELFHGQLDRPLVTKLLQRWSTFADLRRANPDTLKTFLKQHGLRSEERREALVAAIRSAVPLTTDKALVEPYATYAAALARELEHIVDSIEKFDLQIEAAVAVHEDAPIFQSLPGAGAVLVPRLIAAFGSDRDRYESAAQIQNYSGIAPVMKQSGKSRSVQRRRACPKFLRQTFHEFADHSCRWSHWAKAWYDLKRAAGMKHQAVVRALAYKWIRIIFQLWKKRETYSEQRYIQALVKKNSPIAEICKNSQIGA
jgi:transposase